MPEGPRPGGLPPSVRRAVYSSPPVSTCPHETTKNLNLDPLWAKRLCTHLADICKKIAEVKDAPWGPGAPETDPTYWDWELKRGALTTVVGERCRRTRPQ